MSDFRLGDIVETIKGAKFWGEIIAIDNDGNSPGCTVLAVDPGFAGTKHVYPLKQLAHRAPSPSPASRVVEALPENVLEDAAKAAFIKAQSVYRGLHDHLPLKNTWETLTESIRDGWRAIAHAALEAAYMPPLGTQPEPRLPRDVPSALASLSQPAKGELPDRDTSKPAEQQGLFRKFEVRRTDGSDQPGGKHHGCRYFVIDIDHDQYATDALTAYADACARTHPELARDLREKWGAASPANPAQGVREALSDCLDMLARFTHSTSNDLNHVEARAVYRAGRAALAAIGAAPKPPGWPDPLQSPQAEAIRNGKIDHAEILSLFDRIQREIDFHRSSPAEARAERLEAALRRARPYVDCAVHDDGGIDHCDIAYRFDLEAIDDALDVKEAG